MGVGSWPRRNNILIQGCGYNKSSDGGRAGLGAARAVQIKGCRAGNKQKNIRCARSRSRCEPPYDRAPRTQCTYRKPPRATFYVGQWGMLARRGCRRAARWCSCRRPDVVVSRGYLMRGRTRLSGARHGTVQVRATETFGKVLSMGLHESRC